jgi:heme oxygenase
MKVNLKDICKDKEMLKYLQSILRDQPVTKGFATKLEKVIRLYEEIEVDLEMCGESIVEIDMPRLDAIEERNKMLGFLNNADDI